MSEINLDAIIEYQMTQVEASAYKVCLAWCVIAPKKFPGMEIATLRKKGDPRLSNLFRWALKFVKETRGLIPESEYILYIKAQLDILASVVDANGRKCAQISPTCLAGDNAWIRWKIWKRKYDKLVKEGSTKEELGLNEIPYQEIIKELKNTKAFLAGRFEGNLTEEQFKMIAKDVERWVSLGKISGYYALLSPWVKKYCKTLNINTDLYKINDEVRKYFGEHFAHEL